MNNRILNLLFALAVLSGCAPISTLHGESPNGSPAVRYAEIVTTEQQQAEIRALIDQLVFAEGEAQNEPILSPGIANDTKEYRQRFEACQQAFQKLTELKMVAFPLLVEHLDDQRQSIQFRNHYLNSSVGDACYAVITFQLQDEPKNYSEYGYSRMGRDGKQHPKPYYEGTPFDDAGGIKQWLEKNKELTYPEMQIKCLEWLLEKEKTIGASDAESYFVNILPLEIRILERRQEAGQNVADELARLKKILDDKNSRAIPAELLPDGEAFRE